MDEQVPPSGIDERSSEASYQQLARLLAQQIVSRELAAGSRLPQERELSQLHHVSRFTVRNALDVLEAQGLIERVRGKGTFVTGGSAEKRWFSMASTILFVFVGATRANQVPAGGFYGEIYAGIKQAARTLGLQLKTEGIRSYVRVSLDEYRPPKPSEIGGVIVCGSFDEQYIRMFGSEGVPVVAVDLWSHDPQVDSVVVDVESDAYGAIDHLAEKGHASAGFFAIGRQERGSDLYDYDPDIWRLLDNLRRAAQRRRIEFREEWIRLAQGSRMQPQLVARDLLSLRDRPTSLITFDAAAALPVLKAMESLGLRCPEDISVITRGDSAVAGRLATSFVGDPAMMGRQAVRLLVERIQGQRQRAVKVAVTTRLVLGETTGPAPQHT